MRVVIAPDCFGGTLTASEAATAIADGWKRGAPAHDLVLRPLADGGPGFVEVLHTGLGGTLHEVTVTGPTGEPVPATWLEHDGTAYIESADACGLHLVDRVTTSEIATTYGVGELVAAARDAGVRTVVVGLGGSATTDGGAGALAALGAGPLDASGSRVAPGGSALVNAVRVAGPADLGGITLVAASDVENPLLGPHGAAAGFGPQKGATPDAVVRLEAGLARWADVLEPVTRPARDLPSAGAAGGLGFAFLAVGGTATSGAGLVAERTRLAESIAGADLVITGEGSFDWQSLRGKLVSRVAALAMERGLPCLALAGRVDVGRRQAASAGIETAYSVSEHAGSVEASMADPAGTLSALAEHVASQWSG